MASTEDRGKYFLASASRSGVKRVAAKVHAANVDHLFDATGGIDALREMDSEDWRKTDR